jgi:hypothetical protein
MSYLEIDGLTIPVATSSPRLTFDEIGGFARAVSGVGILSRQGTKRSWNIETSPMSEAMASAIETVLSAKGYLWHFSDDAYASNGYTPTTIDNLEYFAGRASAVPMRDTTDVAFGNRFANKSLSVNPTSANGLTQNQSTWDTDTTGATAFGGASLAQDAAYGMDGDGGLRVITAASGGTRGGVIVTGTVGSSTDVCGSAYVMSESAVSIRFGVLDSVVSSYPSPIIYRSITLQPGVWTRLSMGLRTTSGKTDCYLYFFEETVNSNITFYIDHCQAESGQLYPTAWMTGGTSRSSAGQLEISDAGLASIDDAWTMSFWTDLPTAIYGQSAADEVSLFESDNISITATGGWSSTSVSYFDVTATIGNATSGTLSLTKRIYISSAGAPNWHHIAVTFEHDGTGGVTATLFVDAVEEDTDTLDGSMTEFFSLDDEGEIDIGSDAGSSQYACPIFQLLIIPTVATESLLQMLYNNGDGCVFGAWPKHRITGGMIHGKESIEAYVQMAQGSPFDFRDSDGVWQTGRTVRFRLLEA